MEASVRCKIDGWVVVRDVEVYVESSSRRGTTP